MMSISQTVRRAKRGQGKHCHVTSTGMLPTSWPDFLRNYMNKTELFEFLAMHLDMLDIPDGKQLFTTYRNSVISNPHADTSELEPCSHEEGDTCVLVHAMHAVQTGHKRISIRTVDADVLVLAVSHVHKMTGIRELWLAFGSEQSYRHIPAHNIAQHLGIEQAKALPFFHAFTSCDTVSGFFNRSKSRAWDMWQVYPEITPTFSSLSTPHQLEENDMVLLERFTVILYDRTSSDTTVNSCRKDLFTRKGRKM